MSHVKENKYVNNSEQARDWGSGWSGASWGGSDPGPGCLSHVEVTLQPASCSLCPAGEKETALRTQ